MACKARLEPRLRATAPPGISIRRSRIFEQLEDRLEPWLAACPLFEQGSGNTGTFLEGQRDHGFGFDQSARKCVGAVRVDGASLRPRRAAISAMLSPSSSIRCKLRLTDSFSPS